MSSAPRRILVVDDMVDAAQSLMMLLRLEGHDVAMASGGSEALGLLDRFRPDTALIDISMPGMDGFAVARAIRALPWGAEARLIALTGWAAPSQRETILKGGFDAHLAKPASLAELRAALLDGTRPQGSSSGPGDGAPPAETRRST